VRAIVAILAGAALLTWPALLNGYPLVFIDTVSYLNHTTLPEVPWDKTQAYGPFLHLFHWQVSLWPAMAAQGMVASHLAWLAQRMARGAATPAAHVLVCGALGALTSAPWFLATLMPDAFTALAPLCLLLLAFGGLSRAEAAWVALLGALAVAAHLSHLPVALAMLALVALLARRVGPLARAALPVGLAVAFLLAANALAFGRATLSPHGAVFLLARLQGDGPAAAVIRARCPEAGWHLCAFADRLPMDSDEFLWDGTSPLNRNADGSPRPMGGVAGAAEARDIVAATIRDRPVEVAAAMLHNTLSQLGLVRVGDTLGNEHLALSARRPIASAFPPDELAAFDAGAQMRGELPARAAPFLAPHLPVLGLAVAAALWLGWRAARARDLPRGALLAGALLAVLGNAAVTGALSKPHHRYQARIVWLLPAVVLLAGWPPARTLQQPRPAGGVAAPRPASLRP
jgi:hypothetical protein